MWITFESEHIYSFIYVCMYLFGLGGGYVINDFK